MPYSDRSRYRHEEKPRPKGIVRIRTLREGAHEIRLGFTRAGKSTVVAVLHPKGERRKRRNSARMTTWRAHPHSRGEHSGKCSRACRRGMVSHPHRR